MKVLAVLVFLGLVAFCAASLALNDGCESICVKQFLVSGVSGPAEAGVLRTCFAKCLSTGVKDDTVKILNIIERIRAALKSNIQSAEITPIDQAKALSDAEAEVESLSAVSRNDALTATTTVNLRSGPCTDKSVVGSLATGQGATATGESASGCGYTWYKLTSGAWVASNFVRVSSGGGSSSGGSTCNTRNYPLYKQCGQSWSSSSLGSQTVCAIGCLMSSVSMAMNGLGKSINGQAANPGTLNAWLKSHGGYQGNLFVWSAVSSFGLRYQGQITSQADIKRNVCANNIVILNVNNGGHWVLATGVNSAGDYLVNDPGFARSSYRASEVSRAGIFTA